LALSVLHLVIFTQKNIHAIESNSQQAAIDLKFLVTLEESRFDEKHIFLANIFFLQHWHLFLVLFANLFSLKVVWEDMQLAHVHIQKLMGSIVEEPQILALDMVLHASDYLY
jgi:hypothetical protein